MKRIFLMFFLGCLTFNFSLFTAHASETALQCKNVFTTTSEEFTGFRKQPRRRTINRVERKNRWLRFRDSRPDFNDREAYTDWLIERQRAGKIPKNIYGYRIMESTELLSNFQKKIAGLNGADWLKVRHDPIPRIVPIWINETKFRNNDPETWRQYMEWAEEYYKKSNSYPPGYLNYIKDQLRFRLTLSAGTPFGGGGFKVDRHLKDVALALGGNETKDSKLLILIKDLQGNDKWLDSGTGAGFVLEDGIVAIYRSFGRTIDDIPFTLGITYDPPLTDFKKIESLNVSGASYLSLPSQLPKELSKKHQIWRDRLFQDIPIEELMPRSKLITDFLGVYSYSSDPAGVINKYLNILHKDGTIGIAYNNRDIVKVGDRAIPFHEWLKSIADTQIFVEHGISRIRSPAASHADKQGYVEAGYMLIRNPSGNPVKLPSLEMIDAGEGMATERVFRPSSDIIHH